MSEDTQNITLCASSAYDRKYYFNPRYNKLPQHLQKELQIMCVVFTEECGGILTLEFDSEGSLLLKPRADEGDYLYDEIAAGMLIGEMRREKEDLFEALERFHAAVEAEL